MEFDNNYAVVPTEFSLPQLRTKFGERAISHTGSIGMELDARTIPC